MITTLDIIDRLPYEFAARLQADEFFCDIPVVVAEEGNVAAEIAKRQALLTRKSDKRGVAVIVLQMVADDDQPNIQFGPMRLRPSIQIVENLELNRDVNGTKKSARKVARRTRDVMKGAVMQGLIKDLKPDKPCIEPVKLSDVAYLSSAYQVNFTCLECPQGESLAQVQMPQFGKVAGAAQFTISCPTDGATIFYTLDDSYPAEGNPKAIEYAAGSPIDLPVQAGAGPIMIVRACAFKSGMIASGEQRAMIVGT